ncbi:hypothetical protein [Frankia sp. Cr2]|uniref:hypothetical protein n=1 Tax=Frankia sp. Cr2 TaxID=3073932 RepID=UPI002AD25F4C|nr:hypothetical protein [Frankia sp. Cr2]
MRLLSRIFAGQATTRPARQVSLLDAGRSLQSTLDVDAALSLLESIVRTYRDLPYRAMPAFVDAGHVWGAGNQGGPARFVAFDDEAKAVRFLALWPAPTGVTMGLFGIDGSGQSTIIGHWKMRDASLLSTGTFEPGTLDLAAPRLSPKYPEEIVNAAGYPTTASNIERMTRQVATMVLGQAQNFIQSSDPRAAAAFVQDHSHAGSVADLQSILDDLGGLDSEVLPYIQNLPARVRAILLEHTGYGEGRIWDEFDR